MLQYMLDTDTCIYITKNYPQKLLERFNRFSGRLCVSTITLAEMIFGAEKSNKRLASLQGVQDFVAHLVALPFSDKAASHYGEIRVQLERLGKPIGSLDMLIGAHARSEDLTIVTNNTREFERIPGLRIENWI